MKKTNGRSRTGPHTHDVNRNQPEEATPERSTQHSKQPTHEHGMICGMRCICMIWKGMIEPGLNLEIQECHWKGEVISVEINIKITGIGCTVCKWQAKQIWHRSAINTTRPSKCIKNNKLLHSNITTKHMAVIHSRCLTKYEH